MDYTQCILVLNHLKKFGTITSKEAFDMYGITRLAAIIFLLRKEHNISTIRSTGTNRFGRPTRYATYKLNGEKD